MLQSVSWAQCPRDRGSGGKFDAVGHFRDCFKNTRMEMAGPLSGSAKGITMKLREPSVCRVDVAKGELIGATNRYVRTLADLEGLYEDEAAFRALRRELGDAVTYEVTDFKPSADPGDMIFGVTRMRPARSGASTSSPAATFMPRRTDRRCTTARADAALCCSKSPQGEIRAVEIGSQTLCYVPPYWIHRSVNVGADDLVMTFAYPAGISGPRLRDHRGGGRNAPTHCRRRVWRLEPHRQYQLPRPSRLADRTLVRERLVTKAQSEKPRCPIRFPSSPRWASCRSSPLTTRITPWLWRTRSWGAALASPRSPFAQPPPPRHSRP